MLDIIEMLWIRQPTPEQVDHFLTKYNKLGFAYPEVGATRSGLPPGYSIDHNRILLGKGRPVFEAAVNAVQHWAQFDLGWVRLCWPTAPLEVGVAVGILARFLGLYTLSACRIVYLIDEDGPIQKFGFAYGTLRGHVARGEERFLVEWHKDTDMVYYDILAFSRPRSLLFTLIHPVTRLLQKRFTRDSKRAMLKIVSDAARIEHQRS